MSKPLCLKYTIFRIISRVLQHSRLCHWLLVLRCPPAPQSLPSASASEPPPPSCGAGLVSSRRCWSRFRLQPSPAEPKTHNIQNIHKICHLVKYITVLLLNTTSIQWQTRAPDLFYITESKVKKKQEARLLVCKLLRDFVGELKTGKQQHHLLSKNGHIHVF